VIKCLWTRPLGIYLTLNKQVMTMIISQRRLSLGQLSPVPKLQVPVWCGFDVQIWRKFDPNTPSPSSVHPRTAGIMCTTQFCAYTLYTRSRC